MFLHIPVIILTFHEKLCWMILWSLCTYCLSISLCVFADVCLPSWIYLVVVYRKRVTCLCFSWSNWTINSFFVLDRKLFFLETIPQSNECTMPKILSFSCWLLYPCPMWALSVWLTPFHCFEHCSHASSFSSFRIWGSAHQVFLLVRSARLGASRWFCFLLTIYIFFYVRTNHLLLEVLPQFKIFP